MNHSDGGLGRGSNALGRERREMRKGDGRLWTAVLRSMLQSDRSETPGTLPCFPSRAFPSPPTQ